MERAPALRGDCGGRDFLTDSDGPIADVVPIRKENAPGTDLAIPEDGPRTVAEPAVPAAIVAGERKPVIPVPLQAENLKATVSHYAGLTWHRARFHGFRLPLYVIAHLIWALAGGFLLAAKAARWWWLAEQSALRSQAVIDGDAREWRALHKEAKTTRRARGTAVAVVAGLILIAVIAAVRFTPRWAQYSLAASGLLTLAYAGKPRGHRIMPSAVVPEEYEKPTRTLITSGLQATGISEIREWVREHGELDFVSDIFQSGPGWGAHLNLPPGVTPKMVIAKRDKLASGLRRPLSAVWPESVEGEHEARLYLWIGFHDMVKMKQPRHPLLKAGTADIFGSVPFGTDPRLRPVAVPLFEVNWLIGAAPGQGKSNVVRNLLAAASLDPICDIWLHEHAGKGDLESFAKVCHRYACGLDDDAVAYAAESARMLKGELERRQKILRAIPRADRPQGKVTRELAMRDRRLRPIVAVFDEAQVVFLHPEHGSQFASDMADLMRLARAYGIIIILATQRPDKDSVPTTISGIVTARACLKVPDQVSNDMVLGTGSYKAGYDATLFRAKTDAGLCWLKGDSDPKISRSYELNLKDSDKIGDRARLLRARAGVLTGYALGEEEDERPERDVLADLLSVLDNRPAAQWPWIAEALALRFPDRYHDLTSDSISAQCRGLGVASVDVKQDGTVLKGCRKASVVRQVAAGGAPWN